MTTGKELTERLNMHATSIQKAGIRPESIISRDELIRFLSHRRKPGGMWKAEKAALADKWYCELTGESRVTPDPDGANLPAQVSETPDLKAEIRLPEIQQIKPPVSRRVPPPSSGLGEGNAGLPDNDKGVKKIMPLNPNKEVAENHPLKSDDFMVFMLITAIIAQILHTSTFFYFITPISNDVLRYLISIVVGIAVDSAALVTTIRRGNRSNLVIFAVCHFAVNMSAHFRFAEYSEVIDVTAWHFYLDSMILSFLVSYAVYSYAEAFTLKK